MTDARLERLTELARKAWPQDACHIYDSSQRSTGSVMHDVESQSAHVLVMAGDGSHLPLRIEHHPLALDALEAALCVLAGEPLPESCMRDCDGYWLQHKRADAERKRAEKAERELAELRSTLTDYAERWEDWADVPLESAHDANSMARTFAHELRVALKAGEP
jgi:hypothetical protein